MGSRQQKKRDPHHNTFFLLSNPYSLLITTITPPPCDASHRTAARRQQPADRCPQAAAHRPSPAGSGPQATICRPRSRQCCPPLSCAASCANSHLRPFAASLGALPSAPEPPPCYASARPASASSPSSSTAHLRATAWRCTLKPKVAALSSLRLHRPGHSSARPASIAWPSTEQHLSRPRPPLSSHEMSKPLPSSIYDIFDPISSHPRPDTPVQPPQSSPALNVDSNLIA